MFQILGTQVLKFDPYETIYLIYLLEVASNVYSFIHIFLMLHQYKHYFHVKFKFHSSSFDIFLNATPGATWNGTLSVTIEGCHIMISCLQFGLHK